MTLEISRYFDLCLRPASPNFAVHGKSVGMLRGAVFFGALAAAWRDTMSTAAPNGLWLRAATIEQLMGPSDPRFPGEEPDLIDLRPGGDRLGALLQTPMHAWWPLAGDSKTPRTIRLELPARGNKVPLLRKLAGHFPRTRFVIDPFAHGPETSWMPLVRLAECENLWLTTLGLTPGPACCWTNKPDIEEAFHFAMGEVGAGKLLLASGNNLGAEIVDAPGWLGGMLSLDPAQRQLIARDNAIALFA